MDLGSRPAQCTERVQASQSYVERPCLGKTTHTQLALGIWELQWLVTATLKNVLYS